MKAEIVLDIIKFVFGSLGLGSLITAFVTTKIRKSAREKELKCEEQTRLILKQQEINEINAATNKILLRPVVKDMCEEIVMQGYMWDYQFRELEEAYTLYEKQKGNGPTKKKYLATINEYPIVTSEEELNMLRFKHRL